MHSSLFDQTFRVLERFWDFSNIWGFRKNFGLGFTYMILNHHALHHICIITMCVSFVAMICVGRFGLGWAHDLFTFARYMFMHFSCIRTFIYLYFDIDLYWCFSVCFFFLSLSLLVSCSMAPKRKSTPSQNPLRSGASSSFDTTPSHVQFCDDKAHKDFSENFSW